jgi:hypothetical protein
MNVVAILLLSAAATVSPAGAVVFHHDVQLAAATSLTLGEVADLSVLPSEMRSSAAALVVVTIQKSRTIGSVPHAVLASRARSLMPALGPWLPSEQQGSVNIAPRANTNLGFTARCGEDGLEKGASVTLRLTTRDISIDRSALVLQTAKSGQRFFAKAADGTVLNATCEEQS